MKRQYLLWLHFCIALTIVGTRAYGLAESTGPGGSNARAVHELGQIGTDVNVGLIAGKSLYDEHWAFFNKDADGNNIGSTHAYNLDFTGNGVSKWIHDTWMAGIAASRGSRTHPDDTGVAPGADVYCARVINDACQLSQRWLDGTSNDPNGALDVLINTYNCRVIMTGFSFIGASSGQSNYTLMYDYYADTCDVVFTPAAGNGGDDIHIFGDMYNGIVTGGLMETAIGFYNRVGADSGSGPTADGRRKPDVVAPSQGQTMPHSGLDTWATYPLAPSDPNGATSLSGPHTAGVAALLLGLADDTADGDDHHNEVIRAVIVNSAFGNIKDKTGQSTEPATTDPNKFWHKDRGYGRVDALRAYQLLSSPRVWAAGTITRQKGWAYDILTGSAVQSYSIQAQKNHRLVLTVTWNRKPTRKWKYDPQKFIWRYFYYDEDAPKFNIDLTVKDPDGAVVFEEAGSLNNLEKIDLLLPKGGEYEIFLNNTTGKQGDYGLAFELIGPITADFNLDYIVDINDLDVLRANWLQSGLETDVTGEGDTNFRDYAVFAKNLGQTNPAYY